MGLSEDRRTRPFPHLVFENRAPGEASGRACLPDTLRIPIGYPPDPLRMPSGPSRHTHGRNTLVSGQARAESCTLALARGRYW